MSHGNSSTPRLRRDHGARACRALLSLALQSKGADGQAASTEGQGAEECYEQLRSWVDIKAADYVALFAARERRHGRAAQAIKVRCAMLTAMTVLVVAMMWQKMLGTRHQSVGGHPSGRCISAPDDLLPTCLLHTAVFAQLSVLHRANLVEQPCLRMLSAATACVPVGST